MQLLYTTRINKESSTVRATYSLKLPDYIIELVQKTWENRKNSILEYIQSKFEYENEGLYNVFVSSFGRYNDIIHKEITRSEMQEIITNGYLTLTSNFQIWINSYEPLVNYYSVKFEGKELKINDRNAMNKEIVYMIQQSIENSFNVSAEINKGVAIPYDEQINISIDTSNNFTFKGMLLDEHQIDYNILMKDNNLIDSDELNIYPTFNEKMRLYKKSNQEIKLDEWIKSDDIYYKILQNSIEILQIYQYKSIPVYWKESIIESEFLNSDFHYRNILNLYRNGRITINKMMFITFLKNENDILQKLVSDSKAKIFLQDKQILTSILLNKNIEKINVDLNPELVSQIIIGSSVVQTPMMIVKLSINLRDKMLSIKLLNRLSDIDINLMTDNQRKFFEDEQLKAQKLEDEYYSIIGQITASGVREIVGELSKKQKDKLNLSKNFKEWLHKNIGHNKGDIKQIDQQMVNEAKKILNTSKTIIQIIANERNKVVDNLNKERNE